MRNYRMGVSSATVRNEMVALEREGYIFQPHTSAGRVPSAKGYRYYVEALLEDQDLTQQEQRTIKHQFHQVAKGIDELIDLAAAVLSRMLSSVAIVTPPHLSEPRLKLVNLVSLREFLVLLVLVFQDAGFRQQVVSVDVDASQEDLNTVARKLTALYEGLSAAEMPQAEAELEGLEKEVADVITQMMETERDVSAARTHFDGVSHILNQPEFLDGERARMLLELLEERRLISSVLEQAPVDETLRVIIGSENPESEMHDLSLILSRYGMPEESSGVVGVVGPMRMHYARAFSAVRFLSMTMSELLYQLYGYPQESENDRSRR